MEASQSPARIRTDDVKWSAPGAALRKASRRPAHKDRVTKRVTNRHRQQRTQQTLTDGRFQVRHATALAVRTGIWLRDEEANADEKSMCPAARAG